MSGAAGERWLRRVLGVPPWLVVAIVAAISVLLSVGVSSFMVAPLVGQPMRLAPVLWIAVVVPLLVATPVAALIVWLLHELARSREAATRLANRDALTGVLTRRHFTELAAREQALALRRAWPISVLMIDVDHFKEVNDRHGHPTGDAVLAHVAAQCIGMLRTGDLFTRWGGEEFVALLPATDAEGALEVAERLRAGIADAVLPELRHRVTASVGVATGSGEQPVDVLIAGADAAMYEAKRGGRNRVHAAPQAAVPIHPSHPPR